MSTTARITLLLITCAAVALEGCAAGVAAGAGTAAVIAHDRRTTGTFIDDQSIEMKFFNAYRADQELSGQSHISATSFNNIVLLTGEVPSETLRERATRLAQGIEKVREVHNETTLAAPSSALSRSGDAWITSKVKTALLNKDASMATRTKVVTERGTVFLMGILTREEAETVTQIARRVGGVQRVVKIFEYVD